MLLYLLADFALVSRVIMIPHDVGIKIHLGSEIL